MEGVCRSCLVKCNDTEGIYKYSEANRRFFVYSTGIQIKHDDLFVFQLCPECHSNMKIACKFKKLCRSSERKFKSYIQSKELEENIDFNTYLRKHDDSFKLRLPKHLQNSTPNHLKTKDDDNLSTTTSMYNFLKDLQDIIPANDSNIINEVIREEADISDDSLDSHWLHDDASVMSNLKIGLGFSPFSTYSIANDHCYTLQNDLNNDHFNTNNNKKSDYENNQNINNEQINVTKAQDGKRCIIDKNLDKALLDESTDLMALEDLLGTPSMMPNAWVPTTPTLNNILFGEKLDDDVKKCGQNIEQFKEVQGTIDVLDEFLNFNTIQENHQGHGKKDIANLNLIHNTADKNELSVNLRETSVESIVKKNHIKLKDQIENDFNLQSNDSVYGNNLEEYSRSSNKQVIIEEKDKRILLKIKRKSDTIENVSKNNKIHEKNENQIQLEESHVDNKDKEIVVDVFVNPSSPIENKFCLKELICKICNKTFNKSRFLKIHLTKKHNLRIVEPYKRSQVRRICEYCGFESKQSLHVFLKHIQQHLNTVSYTCKRCKLTFSTKARLIKHESTHSGVFIKKPLKKQKKIVCDICGGEFTTSNYVVHMRRHNKDYACKCLECGAGFYRWTDLTVHMRNHTGERPLSCSFCTRSFKKRDALNIHIKTHTGERPYKCEICEKTFTTTSILKTHQTRSKDCLLLQEQLAFGDTSVFPVE